MGFLPEGTVKTSRPNGGGAYVSTLEQAVAKLNPKAKQAMFSAATHGLIKRGTWNGCAFNAGGIEIGNKHVSTIEAAAEAFGCSRQVVSDFICVWDQLPGTDTSATAQLRETIERVGLFSEPSTAKKLVGIVRSRVYTSWETKMREEFDATNEAAPVEGAAIMGKLMSGSCV